METSSSNSSETQDSQTIVITPTQLKELGLADQLKGVIKAQKSDPEDDEVKEEDEEDETEENEMEVDEVDEENEAVESTEEDDENKKKILAIDPCNLQKTMRNKLCTLLNHTPLVMQVKNSPWHKTDSSKQNISIINSKQVVNIELGDEIEDDKRKLTIFSDEKLNFSATEIENMLSSGKTVDSISSPGKCSHEHVDVQEAEAQSTSQQVTKDPGILKKQCLKRIQAKMYENLKKVLDEVDSFPVKDKAALSIKPLTTSEDLDTQSSKSMQNVAKVTDKNKDSKENKPCYMTTYRERKIIELVDKNKSSSSPKPVDDVILITDGDVPEKNTPISERMLPTSDSAVKIPKKRGRPPKNPLKTDSDIIIAKKSEEVQSTPTPEKIVRKRGRPPKKSIINVTIIEEMEKSEETVKLDETPQKGDLEEPPKVEKQNGASEETPTPRKRGRPRKIRPIEPPEEEKEEKKDDSEQSIIQQESSAIESTPEVKIPKKRGRKPKAVILAMREAERLKAEKNAEKTKDTSSSKEYTKSKSGRKRKIVNYSLLNGESSDYSPSEDSDDDDLELEIKVKASRNFYRRKIVKEDVTDDDDDDEEDDEVDDYVESKKTVKRIRETDEGKDVAKKIKIDEDVEKMNAPIDEAKKTDAEKSNDAREQTDESNKTDESIDTTEFEEAKKAPNERISDEPKKTDANDDGAAKQTDKIDAQQKNEKADQSDEEKNDASNDGKGAQQKNDESKRTEASNDGIDAQQKNDESKKSDASNDDAQQENDESKKTDASTADIADELIKVEKVKCGVCNVELEESWWLEHKRKIHNDLAWKIGEEPLNLEDGATVREILNKVLLEDNVLRCDNCDLTMDSISNFIGHIKNCSREIDSTFLNLPKSRKRKKTSAAAEVLTSLFSNINTAKKEEDSSEHPSEEVLDLNSIKIEEVTLQKDEVQCGVCQNVFHKTKWSAHKLSIHNNLAWKVGDPPLDLNNHQVVVKILTDLYNKKKPLFCDNCGSSRKSVIGFLSHRARCNKSSDEISDMKVTCKLCDKRMLPVSLARHIVLLHGSSDNNREIKVNDDKESYDEPISGKRKAAHKAFELIQNFKDEGPVKIKRFVKGVRFRSKDEIITRFNEEIHNYQEASCVFENCNYTAGEAEDLFQHLENCAEKCDDGYTCNYCLATFKSKRTIRDHVSTLHQNDDKNCIIMHNISSDEESYNENNASDVEEKDDEFDNSKIKSGYIKTLAKFLANTRKKATNICYPYAYKWTLEYYDKNCSIKLFPDVTPNKNGWEQIKPSEILNYLPKLKRSIDFTIRTVNAVQNPINSNYNWINYKLFESSIDKNGCSTIFCGGPISSMTWLPTPYNQPLCDQILAVSVLPEPDKNYYRLENYKNEGLIQFWNYGPMDNKKVSTTKPSLEFCIGHKLGPIWCMEWCPSGCYDADEGDGLKKMGLLAVTSCDGAVYIYAVLRPKQLQGKIFEVKPTIKLISEDFHDQNLGDNNYQATRISWSKVTGHSYIAVGYSNGVVSIFNLNTKSKLLRNVVDDVIILKPIQQFKAHHDCITALVLHHLNDGNRWLITGALDRDCKFWDLKNVLEPITSSKKFIITDATWSLHWLFALYTYDHATLVGSVPSALIPIRNFNGAATTFLPSNSRTTSISCSDWGNIYIQANDNGEITCGFPDQLLQDFDADKRKSVRKCRILTSYTGFVAKKLSPEERKQIELKKMASEKKKNPEIFKNYEPRTYDEFYSDYGLVICDLSMNYKKTCPSEELDKLMHGFPYHSLYKPAVYPMQTINKIVLNPNRNSFLYYACGYQAGLVRTSVLKFLNNP